MVLQVISSPMVNSVKIYQSISFSCPTAKTRITDLVSRKVQQVQRPQEEFDQSS